MQVKILILLNFLALTGPLLLGYKINDSLSVKTLNLPIISIAYYDLSNVKTFGKITVNRLPLYKEKIQHKEQIAVVENKVEIKAAAVKRSIPSLDEIETKDKMIVIEEAPLLVELRVKEIKQQEMVADKNMINNEELIKDVDYKPVAIQSNNWLAYFESQKVEQALIALNELEQIIQEPVKLAETTQKEESIVDTVTEVVSAKKKEKAKADDELVFFEYNKPTVVEQVKEVVQAKPENIDTPKLISNNVNQVIEREMTSQEAVKILASSIKRETSQEEKVKTAPEPEPTKIVHKTTTIKAIEVSINRDNEINKVNTFSFIPDYDQNLVYDSDAYNSLLSIDVNTPNDYSSIRGRLDSQGMLVTRMSIPFVNSHSQIEVPLFNQASFFDFLESNEVEGYGGYLLVDLYETNVIDIDLVSINNTGHESYEKRIFLDNQFRVTTAEKEFRYAMFLNVHPGVVMIRFLRDSGEEIQKPNFVLSDEMLFEAPRFEYQYSEIIKLMEETSLASLETPTDISEDLIGDFYTDISPRKESLNEYTIRRNDSLVAVRKYLELNHHEAPMFIGYSDNKKLTLPSMDYVNTIKNELNITLDRECLIQINLKKDIYNIQMHGEAINGPLSYEGKYLGNDGYFTDLINGNSKKLFIVGMEPGIVSLHIEYADQSSEYFQTFCSEGSYLVEQL